MRSNASLIEGLIDSGMLHTPVVIEAFKKTDRKTFVPKELRHRAYADEPLPIGFGQTISQPRVVAFMLELLRARLCNRVLDVGSGSGYTTALLAELVGPCGKVFGVEIIPELVAYGKANLAPFHFNHSEIRQANAALGLPEEAPFDAILVSASAKDVPTALVSQLRNGGRMVLSVGEDILDIEKKPDGSLETKTHYGFVFVPLVENSRPARGNLF